jgi:PAS domain S-box-containing protein
MLAVDPTRSDRDPGRWPFAGGEMAQRVREHDWAATPLGAAQRWPAALRTTVQLLLAHPFASIVLWGHELIQIYNDAYRDLMGAKHPAGLGQPTRECWPEVWHINAPIYERVWQGESVSLEDALFPIVRAGRLEDAWFSLTYSPVRDESGGVAGVFLTIIETTRRLRAEAALRETQARQAFLLHLSDALRPLHDAQAIKLQATRLLGEQLGANRVFYAEVRGDDWLVAKGYEQGVEPLPDGLYAARTYGRWIMATYRAAERFVLHDIDTDPRFSSAERQAHADVRVLGAVGVPLVKQGTLVAILAVHSATPRYWSPEELALVEETAERTWAAVERAQAQAALRESEAQMRAVANLVPDLLWRSDIEGEIQWYSERWFEYTGQAPHEALGRGWTAVLHPDDVAESLRCWGNAVRLRLPYVREHRLRRRDGQYRWFLSRAVPLHECDGSVALWFGSAADIHEQRSAREELESRVRERTHELQQAGELRRQLLTRVETLQDEERRRIARELHDSIGQMLSAMLLSVAAVRARLPGNDAALATQLDKLQQLMQTVDLELDRIVFTLRPTALEDGGLGDAVTAYVAMWSDLTGQPVDLLLTGLEGRRLPLPVEAAVFRVIQEALNNIAKHARAGSVGVSIERLGRVLVASVEDDGVGFDTEPAEPLDASRPRWGLLGMRERIEAVGGEWLLESQPGQGTTVLLRVPLPNEDRQDRRCRDP